MPEYLKKRYGGKRLRIYNAIIQVVMAILTGISVSIISRGNNSIVLFSLQNDPMPVISF